MHKKYVPLEKMEPVVQSLKPDEREIRRIVGEKKTGRGYLSLTVSRT